MAPDIKSNLVSEYVRTLNSIYMPISKFSAINRFDIKNGQIISKSKYSLFHSIIAVLMVNLCAFLILHEITVIHNYALLPEYMSVIQFTILSTVTVLNVNFPNRHSGAELMTNLIEIDAFLGIEETRFMRRITCKDAVIMCSFVACVQVLLITVLALTFQLPIFTYICGVIYFCLLFCITYDLIFHVVLYKFICMRVHYLNVALVKTAELNTKYLTQQMLEYPILWKKGYDDFVNFPSNMDSKYCIDAFKMIFDQQQRIMKCYRFVIFTSTVCLVISTFLAVQSVIIFIKDPEVPVIRTMSLVGWFIAGWTIFAAITQQIDKFHVQIQRTKLICTYIQLKPDKPDEIYELSKNILDTLSVRDHRYPIYDMFYYDGRLMISIATSVFIYITMQLQIAFPKGFNQKENATST